MTFPTRNAAVLALGLALVGLTGCDAAEESAQNLVDEAVEKSTELARQLVTEVVGDAVEQVNEQLDDAQKRVNETLGTPAEEQSAGEQAADGSTEEDNRG